MRTFGGVVTAIAVAVLFMGTAASTSHAQTASAAVPKKHYYLTRAFDGVWSVSIFTQAGSCPASLRYPAVISNGQVVKADGEFGYDLSGAVYSSGFIVVTVSAGGQSATGRGHLNRTRGGGTWVAMGGQCGGIWEAMRRS
jgi:hypothetical protein